jgi:group I intron endonuclease
MKKFIDIKNCIYSIENNINKKKYIGQTIDLEVRINNHYTNIFKKTNNILLMNDIDKYGIENFTFSILEILNKELLPKKESLSLYLHYREKYYMDKYKTCVTIYGDNAGYNIGYANKLDINKIDINNKTYYKQVKMSANFKELALFLKNNRDNINNLTKLYFEYCPNMNRGLKFKIKAQEIINTYLNKHGMTVKDVEDCIKKYPMCQQPIWQQFYDYWYKEKNVNKNKNNIEESKKQEKSNYKSSIGTSLDPNDWI